MATFGPSSLSSPIHAPGDFRLQNARLLRELIAAIGETAVKSDEGEMSPYLVDWRGRYQGRALCVVEPTSAEQVAAIAQTVSARGAKIVPQGGNTGLVGGGVPLGENFEEPQIVLSLRRLNRIRDLDTMDNVMIAEAGVVLQHAQEAARIADRLLPISLASEGSAQIGGVVSTNAGGTSVLRYGATRDLVVGLEVVLADGTIWHGLQRLRKNNAGYDLKQLFIGSEGTLGIVTAAAVKLFPLPKTCVTAFVTVPTPDSAVRLLRFLQSELGDSLTAFELIDRTCLDLVLATGSGARDPFERPSSWYVLVEVSTTLRELNLTSIVETSLAKGFDQDLVLDAVLAQNEVQRAELWRLREEISEAERRQGPSVKHDISIPISKIPDFLNQISGVISAKFSHAKPTAFGHVGDGNIHFNVLAPIEDTDAINDAVYSLVTAMGGSISAEHGIGSAKIELLTRYKDDSSLSLMRCIRSALDPSQILNPGKLIHFP